MILTATDYRPIDKTELPLAKNGKEHGVTAVKTRREIRTTKKKKITASVTKYVMEALDERLKTIIEENTQLKAKISSLE